MAVPEEWPAALMMCIIVPGSKVAGPIELFMNVKVVVAFYSRPSLSESKRKRGRGSFKAPIPLPEARRGCALLSSPLRPVFFLGAGLAVLGAFTVLSFTAWGLRL